MANQLSVAMVLSLTDKITGPLRNVVNAVGGIGDAAEKAANKFTRLHNQIDKLAKSAQKLDAVGKPLAAFGVVSAAGITATVAAFSNLEEAQNRLKTNVMDNTGKVGDEYEKLLRLAEKLGTDLPGSTKDMVEMFTALREQGVQTKMILGGYGEAAAKFATVMKLPFAEAATHVAKFSESMGIADKDANQFMDTIQRLKSSSGVEVGDLAYTFKYAGGALKMLNIQGIEGAKSFSTVIGMLANAGIEGSTAGTNMAQALARMAEIGHRLDKKAIQKLVGPILDKHGIKLNFFDEKGNFKGLREMTAELEKLKALNPQEQIITLKKLFGDEAARPLAILLKQGVAGFDEMAKRMQTQADMQQKIKVIMQGVKMQWETMMGTIANVIANIGATFAKVLNLGAVLGKLNTLFGKMNDWILANPKLAALIGGTVAAVTALALVSGGLLMGIAAIGGAIGPFLAGMAAMSKVIGIVSMAFRALTLSFMSNPIGLIAVGIAAAAFLIYKYWKPISAFMSGIWQSLKVAFAPLANEIKKAFGPLMPALRPVIDWFKSLFGQADYGKESLSNITKAGVAFGKILAWAIKIVFFPLISLIRVVVWLGQAIGNVAGWIVTNWQKILRVFLLVNPITRPFAILNALIKKVTGLNLFQAGANIFKTLADGMKSMISRPVEVMKSVIQKMRNFLPFSPAKEGPFRDIHRVKIMETIASSMRPGPMVHAMRTATAATMMAAAVPATGMAAGHGAGSAGPGVSINFAPVINLAAGSPAETRQQVDQALSTSKAELERMIEQIMAQKQRRAF